MKGIRTEGGCTFTATGSVLRGDVVARVAVREVVRGIEVIVGEAVVITTVGVRKVGYFVTAGTVGIGRRTPVLSDKGVATIVAFRAHRPVRVTKVIPVVGPAVRATICSRYPNVETGREKTG